MMKPFKRREIAELRSQRWYASADMRGFAHFLSAPGAVPEPAIY